MYTRYLTLLALAGFLGISTGPVSAHSNDQATGGHSGYGRVSMMGSGAGSMMGWSAGSMMGSGTGSAAGTVAGGSATAGSQELGGDYLDQLGDRITERYQLKQRIASTKDKAARRDLVRQYVQDVHGYGGANWASSMRSGAMGYGSRGYGGTGYGMMPYGGVGGMMGYGNPGYGGMGYGGTGYGMMPYGGMGGMMGYGPGGYGMMGPRMGAYGRMGYGMMGYGPSGYGTMGPGMMGYGPMGYGMMGPGMGYGMMGYAGMGPAMMDFGQLSDEQLDRMADLMAEGYKTMQQIAQTKDKAERRKLLREHFNDMMKFWQGPQEDE